MNSGVYQIVCKIDGKVYIGGTKNLRRRWAEHKSMLRNKKHHSAELQQAWDKYSEDDFAFEVLGTTVSKEDTKLLEQYWMDKKHSAVFGFNVEPFAGSSKGRFHPEEVKSKIRHKHEAREHKKLSDEAKVNMSLAAIERSKSDMYRLKQSLSHLGKTVSEETRKKISDTRKARMIPAPNKGIPHTAETIAKIKAKVALRKGQDLNARGSNSGEKC